MRGFKIALFVVVLTMIWPLAAPAKSSKIIDYRYETIWATSIRFIRVDRGYSIKDKDKDTGYVLFIYPGSGAVKDCPASLEILTFTDEQGYRKNRVQLSIEHQPSYVEMHFLDGLEDKLREEQGSPPPPERAKKPKEASPKKKETEEKKKPDG